MNTLESYSITNPKNVTDECAKFVIDDTGSPFILSEIMQIDTRYTFSFWIKSEASGSVQACGKTFTSTNDWQKHSIVFTATSKDLTIGFLNAGVYYIYHPQLELGNMVTDWSPAPEDLDPTDELAETNDRIQTVHKLASSLEVTIGGIRSTVESYTTTVNGLDDEIKRVDGIVSDFEQTAEQFKLDITTIQKDGVTKVSTTSGVFDDKGLTVDNTESPTKSTLTPDGMTVYNKKPNGELDEVLEATSEGVNATNLHATTYLIVGGRSRFENYGTDRTGCFWIGG